ncbi:24096_t:CDS:2 [Dentiscutata erythropus]|uniref:24096_t:CDS:1 n=1 Tax=Dentiscutata erythropus TaxID=1348616 RepID=A0A9N9DB73_9GLOM|nr:24096_t:CDS:2 [Dentiscutata erythropus]
MSNGKDMKNNNAVDSSIFRNLVKIINLLSGQLSGLSITASSAIIKCSFTSRSLANKVTRNQLLFNDSAEVVRYLNEFSDQTFKLGETVEKMYPTGESGLRELGMELTFIIEKIQPDQILTRKNELYFEKRYRRILNVVTRLRDQFQKVMNEIDVLSTIYSGTRHQLENGINDVEAFFNNIAPIMNQIYDTERITRDLGYLKRIMEKVPNIRNQINYLLFEFNQYRQVLIWYCDEWAHLQRRKLVSLEDIENLKVMVQGLDSAAEIFKKKVNENVDLVIYAPNNYQPPSCNWEYLNWVSF